MSLPTVAIIGGTGFLGQQVSNAFLTDFRPSFSRIRVLTRDPSSQKAQDLASKGAELIQYSGDELEKSFDEVFAGADVIVNALPGGADKETKQAIIKAIARSGAKVYFLSEFGSDHRINAFPGYESEEWLGKQEVAKETRAAFKGKVIALYTSAFIELAVKFPALGIDVKNNAFTAYGSPTTKISLTSLADIGRAVAQLSILATDPATAASVPDDIRIAGDTVTIAGVRDIVARVKGVAPGEIKTVDVAPIKETLKGPSPQFFDYLRRVALFPLCPHGGDGMYSHAWVYNRVVLGEGKADFSSQNDNELVNPGGKLWKWKSVEEAIGGL
ncbi:NAD(P)-binding protein [Dichomitus squalens LYAD-421 SS1]|uniref:NAD(P)-binding protein n=1 Tax=Dichomitus squalens (strain LYAD-421) TaxID=732165 RepID=UPI0004412F29|nr:NAD(P)-binding protein [Dichomitus squalens LYAD-421 SS1]EJF62713.1 NAD(P)-binding protein [Dichomitus squalens LYAD-421 SS1]